MLKLHEIMVKEGRVLIGREIEIDTSKIQHSNELTIWNFDTFMPPEEKSKIDLDKLSKAAGTLLEVDMESAFIMVAEDINFINQKMQVNN